MFLPRSSSPRQPTGRSRSRRTGLATLELVLALPLIVLLFYFCFMTFAAFGRKTHLVQQSRHGAFQKIPATQPNRILQHRAPPTDGLAEHAVTAELDLLGDRAPEAIAGGRTQVVSGSWDHERIPFADGLPPLTPHQDVARQFADNQPTLAALPGVLMSMANVMHFSQGGPVVPLAAMSRAHRPIIDVYARGLQVLSRPLRQLAGGVRSLLSSLPRWMRGFRSVLSASLGVMADGMDAIPPLVEAADGQLID
jgi:hypothetical protein